MPGHSDQEVFRFLQPLGTAEEPTTQLSNEGQEWGSTFKETILQLCSVTSQKSPLTAQYSHQILGEELQNCGSYGSFGEKHGAPRLDASWEMEIR